MASKIQFRRGLKSKLPKLSSGEPAYATDTRELFMGTGSENVNIGGSHWYNGTAMSGTSTSTTYYYSACPQVKLGDMYLNTTYGYVYECTAAGSGVSARWTYRGSIKGAQGDKGDQGDSPDVNGLLKIFSALLPNLDATNHIANGYWYADYQIGKTYYMTAAGGFFDYIKDIDGNGSITIYKSDGVSTRAVLEGTEAVIKFVDSQKAIILLSTD